MKNFSLKNLRKRHFLYALLAVGFLISCTSNITITEIFKKTLNEITVGEFVNLMFFTTLITGLITK